MLDTLDGGKRSLLVRRGIRFRAFRVTAVRAGVDE